MAAELTFGSRELTKSLTAQKLGNSSAFQENPSETPNCRSKTIFTKNTFSEIPCSQLPNADVGVEIFIYKGTKLKLGSVCRTD